MDEFIKHENNAFTPSISQNGQLRKGTKSDLLTCLLGFCDTTGKEPVIDAKILDGPAVVQLLSPRGCKTFDDYFSNVFLSYVSIQLISCERLDIRKKVTGSTPIPNNWQGFLELMKIKRNCITSWQTKLLNI